MIRGKKLKHAALVGLLATTALTTSAAAQSAPRQVDSVMTEAGPVAVQNMVSGLDHPWGMAFLPDGRLLVTERSGTLRILGNDRTLSEPLGGVPVVYAQGQGGLLDVALDPEFAENRFCLPFLRRTRSRRQRIYGARAWALRGKPAE